MKKILIVLAIAVVACTRVETNKQLDPTALTDFHWALMPAKGSPAPRKMHSATWTGKEWLIWGGILITDPERGRELYGDGASFEPANQVWSSIPISSEFPGRFGHSAVWTGTEMMIWGGARADTLNTGARYNPATRTWALMKTPENFSNRYFHTGLWTGDSMVIWGGLHLDLGGLSSGSEYDPKTDTWFQMPASPLAGRHHHTANLVHRKIYYWGGLRTIEVATATNDGASYDLKKRTWQKMSVVGAPSPRGFHTAVYGRKQIFVWGGMGPQADGTLGTHADGAIYDTKADTWKKMSSVNAPSARHGHTAIWTGKKMLVWGGIRGGTLLSDGALYDPETDTWEPLPAAPEGFKNRYGAASSWTGEFFLIWGGSFSVRSHSELGDGAILRFPTRELGE